MADNWTIRSEVQRTDSAGQIGAIYTGRMDYGPRGARRALELNMRLDRTEFMPFAPVIAAR
jgi:predicted NodU family carbamoyl transferase